MNSPSFGEPAVDSPALRIASRIICWFGIIANVLFAFLFLRKPDWWLYEEMFGYSSDFEKALWLVIVLSLVPIGATVRYISK